MPIKIRGFIPSCTNQSYTALSVPLTPVCQILQCTPTCLLFNPFPFQPALDSPFSFHCQNACRKIKQLKKKPLKKKSNGPEPFACAFRNIIRFTRRANPSALTMMNKSNSPQSTTIDFFPSALSFGPSCHKRRILLQIPDQIVDVGQVLAQHTLFPICI